MAKQSIVKVIKAKPGSKAPHYGKYANSPMQCETKGCENEANVHYGPFNKRHKVCWDCHGEAPKSAKVQTTRQKAAHKYLKSIGVAL